MAFQRWLNLLGGDVQLFYQGLPNAFNRNILYFANTNILSVYLFCKGDYVPFMSKVHKRVKSLTYAWHPISDFYFDEICCFFNNKIGDSFPYVI
jgi:hypothetical protein